MRLLLSPRLLLPLMMFIAVLILGLSLGDLRATLASGNLFGPTARAEAKAEAVPASPAAPAVTPPSLAPTAPPAAPATKDAPPEAAAAPPPDDDVSPAEMDVLKQLSTRRAELDKRNRDLDTREAVIKVAEQRVDQKIKELETLRTQLQGLVNQANEQQAAQLDNLVKIYETMKPEEAAHIFETLDMPVLLSVIQRMKPKSTAPIMAKMEPQKAKELTVALTKQDQLPAVK